MTAVTLLPDSPGFLGFATRLPSDLSAFAHDLMAIGSGDPVWKGGPWPSFPRGVGNAQRFPAEGRGVWESCGPEGRAACGPFLVGNPILGFSMRNPSAFPCPSHPGAGSPELPWVGLGFGPFPQIRRFSGALQARSYMKKGLT